jgi:hypothetical protein
MMVIYQHSAAKKKKSLVEALKTVGDLPDVALLSTSLFMGSMPDKA